MDIYLCCIFHGVLCITWVFLFSSNMVRHSFQLQIASLSYEKFLRCILLISFSLVRKGIFQCSIGSRTFLASPDEILILASEFVNIERDPACLEGLGKCAKD